MAISRRPKPTLVASAPAVDVDALINKGGQRRPLRRRPSTAGDQQAGARCPAPAA